MDSTTTLTVEPVTISDVLQLASWDRARSDDELNRFIAHHEVALLRAKE